MTDQPPLDLRSLAEVDEPEVVRAALRTFRRRLWTRYVWIGLAIVIAAVALVVGNRPSNLREEMEAANVRAFPPGQVWRVRGLSIALAEAADLGDTTGLHFVVIPDTGVNATIHVDGQTYGLRSGDYDIYTEAPKTAGGSVRVFVGVGGCLPYCESQEAFVVDLRALGVPPQVWREGK